MEPRVKRRCHLLIAIALVLLTTGIGYDFLVGTQLADLLVIIASLLTGSIVFLYVLGVVRPIGRVRHQRSRG